MLTVSKYKQDSPEVIKKKWLRILTFNKHNENYVLMSLLFINVKLSTV
jgi:hypothetical protein